MAGLDNRGRNKGGAKTGGAVVGSITTQTADVKRAILRVFMAVNGDDEYLNGVAQNDKKLFLNLVARILPTEVAVEQKLTIDLGAGMAAANERVAQMYTPVIDHEPADVTPEPVIAPQKPQPPLTDPRVLDAADQVAVTEADRWPGYE